MKMEKLKVNQIIEGDILSVALRLPSRSVNCIVTSPPYWGLRDYGTAKWEGGDRECDHRPGSLSRANGSTLTGGHNHGGHFLEGYKTTCAKCGAIRIDSQLGLEETPEAYGANLVSVFRELWRVLRDDGTLWLVIGDSYAADRGHQVPDSKWKDANNSRGMRAKDFNLKPKDLVGIPWLVAFALRADGWYLRNDIIWHKPSAMPESVTDRCTKDHEYIFLLTKQAKYWYDQDAIREEAKSDYKNRGGSLLNDTGWHTSARGGDTTRRNDRSNDDGTTRNKRTVWTVSPKPYKGAHFATFPPDLIEPCILAGCPSRVCVECGEPWVRVVEKTDKGFADRTFRSSVQTGGTPGMTNGQGKTTLAKIIERRTTCFSPACQCCPLPANKESTIPGVVLDPFFGLGTVAEVAIKTKRDWLGVELNPEYIKLAKDRIWRTQPPLFVIEDPPVPPAKNEFYRLARERDALKLRLDTIDSEMKEIG